MFLLCSGQGLLLPGSWAETSRQLSSSLWRPDSASEQRENWRAGPSGGCRTENQTKDAESIPSKTPPWSSTALNLSGQRKKIFCYKWKTDRQCLCWELSEGEHWWKFCYHLLNHADDMALYCTLVWTLVKFGKHWTNDFTPNRNQFNPLVWKITQAKSF